MVPKDVHTQILRTCDNKPSHDKRYFADVIKVIDFEIRKLSRIV